MDELREYLESEFAKMGKQLLDSMDQRIGGLRDEVRGEIHGLREEMNARIDETRSEMRSEFVKMDQRIGGVRDDLQGEIRQTHVLVEHARDEIRTVAEGVASNTERIDRLREESHRERQEIRNELVGHLRSSHQSLDRRVSRFEESAGEAPRRMPRL